MSIKMGAAIPVDHNGLSAIYGALVREPLKQHVIIAVVDSKSRTIDSDTSIVSPTVRLRHVEVVPADSVDTARAIMQRALEDRTGETTLPFEEPFGNVVDLSARLGLNRDRDE
jgi:hypothetical protein